MLTTDQIAWAAGFFDGEGCVILRPSSKLKALRIAVSQVNPAPILKFKEYFGGHISFQKSKNKNWKDQWKWEQDCKSASQTLELLLPYLIVKHDVAKLGLEFQKTKKKGTKATPEKINLEQEFKERISALNRSD